MEYPKTNTLGMTSGTSGLEFLEVRPLREGEVWMFPGYLKDFSPFKPSLSMGNSFFFAPISGDS